MIGNLIKIYLLLRTTKFYSKIDNYKTGSIINIFNFGLNFRLINVILVNNRHFWVKI